jgi:autotransporter-associated beta strand protein
MATLLCAGALGAVGHSAFAANDLWIGNTDANFGTLANWTGSVSPNGNTPEFGVAGTSGTTLTNDISSATYTGVLFDSGASAYTIGGNSFTLSGGITNNSTSTQTINNTITLSTAAHTINAASGNLALGGAFSGTSGNITFSGSGTTTLSGTNTFKPTSANFTSFIVTGNMSITGATTVDGTGFTDYRGYLDQHGPSTITVQSGGSLAINPSTGSGLNSGIAQNAAGTSTVAVNGGSFSLSGNSGLMLGNNRADAIGVITVTSGTATLTAGSTTLQDVRNFVAMGRDGATGIINLDGGTLATGRQFVRDGSSGGTAGSGTATFNFNGGVLQAQANQTQGNGWFETATTGNFQVVTTTVKSGGAKIDTNGFTTNVNTVLAHDSTLGGTPDGGLTKSGTGTLSLGATSTFTGATTVSAGTLKVNGSIATSSDVTINGSGATLAGTGTVSGITLTSGTITPGDGGIGTLAASSLDWAGGNTLTFDLSSVDSTADLLSLSGALTKSGSGTYAFDFSGGLVGQTYSLINFGSNSGFSVGDFSVNSGISGTFGLSGTSLTFTAVPEPHEFAIAIVALLGVLVFIRRRNHQA